MKMVNNQTGPQGIIAQKILISPPLDIKKEYYIGAAIDRMNAEPILIASKEGEWTSKRSLINFQKRF